MNKPVVSEELKACGFCGMPESAHEPSGCCGDGGGSVFSPQVSGEMVDETGWLIEEDATGVIHWIALAKDQWPYTKENRFTDRFGFEDYLSPVVRVKDANEAIRFARKEDAEAFIELFRRFLLVPSATEHCWPALASQLPEPLEQQQP